MATSFEASALWKLSTVNGSKEKHMGPLQSVLRKATQLLYFFFLLLGQAMPVVEINVFTGLCHQKKKI